MTCPDCKSAECEVDENDRYFESDAMVRCLKRQLAVAKAENKRLASSLHVADDEIERWKMASGLVTSAGDPDGIIPEQALRYWENVEAKLGPVYSLFEGHSVSERGTLTNGEGGILQARNVWTLADLQRAEALAVGAQCKLDCDEVWIRREE